MQGNGLGATSSDRTPATARASARDVDPGSGPGRTATPAAPPPLPRGARPAIRVGLVGEGDLVLCGLSTMLLPYRSRVRLLEVPAAGRPQAVQVLLVDPFLGDEGDHDAEQALRPFLAPGMPPVLVYTWSTHPVAIRRVLDAGARGYLVKNSSADEVVAAVETIARGGTVLPRVPGLTGATDAEGSAPMPSFTPREQDVLMLLCRGLTNAEIGQQLFVSTNSVKTYLRQIYAKVGMSRRTQVVTWARDRGF